MGQPNLKQEGDLQTHIAKIINGTAYTTKKESSKIRQGINTNTRSIR